MIANSRSILTAVLLAGGVGRAAPALRQPIPDRLDLPQAIAFALENNFAIRQARERIRQQEGVATTVWAAAIPNISAGGSFQKSDVPTVQIGSAQTPLFVPVGQSWRMNLTFTQALFSGGGIGASIREAELGREAAMFAVQAVINDALLDVRVRFYDVLLAREQITVQEQNLELLQEQLRYANARAQAGTISEFEQLRAEVAVANAKVPLIRSRNAFRLAIEELRRAVGFTANDPSSLRKVPEIVGTLTFEPANFDLAAALTAAQENRPDLRRLDKLIAAGEAGVTVARSRYFPSLTLNGGGDLRKGPTNRFGDSVKGLRIAGQSNWEINPRATSGVIAQAASQVEQTRLAESEARLAAEVEVRRVFSAIEQSSELAKAMQQTVAQAEEAVRLATARFDARVVTQIDVLQTQVDLTYARTSQLGANHGYSVALAQLRKATGVAEIDYHQVGVDDRRSATPMAK